jgi:hypothetical protein
MVISSGLGILGLIIPVVVIVAVMIGIVPPDVPGNEAAVERATDKAYVFGGLLAAAVVWPLGRRLNNPDFDPENLGTSGGRHTMFFVPLQYWAIFWPVVGLFRFLG